MAQILAIDYGKARCGIAVTDDLQLIASGLQTIATPEIFTFLAKYFAAHSVETLVVGLPTDLRGQLSEIETEIKIFLENFRQKFPGVAVERFDERFTSKMASYFISQSGKNKKSRENKALIDKVSATLILQNFLEQKQK